MTREQQDTERALVHAERGWLRARGWTLEAGAGSSLLGGRYSHPAAPTARPNYAARDAMAMTRAEPLRYTTRRYTAGPA